MSEVKLSIGVNGIANTSVCVPVSGGTLIHEGVAEVQLGLLRQRGIMVSVITACTKCTDLLWSTNTPSVTV